MEVDPLTNPSLTIFSQRGMVSNGGGFCQGYEVRALTERGFSMMLSRLNIQYWSKRAFLLKDAQ